MKDRPGKCARQLTGLDTIGKIPSQVATYTDLSDAHSYTGHCFRRFSVSVLVNSGRTH